MSNQEQQLSQETFLRLSNLARTIRNRAKEHPDDESAMDTYKDADELDALLNKFITDLIVEGRFAEPRIKAESMPRAKKGARIGVLLILIGVGLFVYGILDFQSLGPARSLVLPRAISGWSTVAQFAAAIGAVLGIGGSLLRRTRN